MSTTKITAKKSILPSRRASSNDLEEMVQNGSYNLQPLFVLVSLTSQKTEVQSFMMIQQSSGHVQVNNHCPTHHGIDMYIFEQYFEFAAAGTFGVGSGYVIVGNIWYINMYSLGYL